MASLGSGILIGIGIGLMFSLMFDFLFTALKKRDAEV